jgi:hypothetical protein
MACYSTRNNQCLDAAASGLRGRSKTSVGYFVVKDNNGQPLLFIAYREAVGRRSLARLLTRNAARRIAANIAKLPELLRKL